MTEQALPPGPAWLFCPADRPERYTKAAAVADVVILDLEDGVAPEARRTAREALAERSEHLDPTRTVIRVNPSGTEDHGLDLELLEELPFQMVMLAKTEGPDQVAELRRRHLATVALCETPRGITSAQAIAAEEGCLAVMWGAEDLIAAIGGTSSREESGRYRQVATFARSQVLLAAASESTPALDAVYLDIPDLRGLAEECADAVASGFTAKVCIHPSQVQVVRDAFSPTSDQLAWAHRVISAHEASPYGVFSFEGQMIDEPLLRQARRTIERVAPPRG